jgi:DNA mismatch endonuclease (patch repair protein)
MTDVHSKETRSYNMSRIRSKDTKPEIVVRKYLFSQGFRYRKNDTRYPGTPDIVLPKYKTAIFINGCFWHMHADCPKFVMPKTNVDFWQKKLQKNQLNDFKKIRAMEALGWNVIIIWECELGKAVFEDRMETLIHEIQRKGST